MNEIEAYNQFSNMLNGLQPYSIDLTLSRIKTFLNIIGNPQNSFKSIIVGGTNGKGSVCQFLTDAFIDANFKVGTYTSPHLIQINERFRINNKSMSYSRLLEYAKYVKANQNGAKLTYFEFLTALAFVAFKDLSVDMAVLEVGMGGEFDATNVVNPIMSIITHISLDHEEHLGKTHIDIAKTKSKIIKHLGVIGKNAKSVIDTIKNSVKADLFFVDGSYVNRSKSMHTYMSSKASKENLATALLAVDVLNRYYNMNLRYEAIKKTFWPGRFEVIKSCDKTFILDGAHNKNAASKLALSLKNIKGDKVLIFSTLKQKDWKNNLKILLPYFRTIILVPILNHHLSENPERIKKFIGSTKKTMIYNNLNKAIFSFFGREEKLAIITGSLYLVGEAKACSIGQNFLP